MPDDAHLAELDIYNLSDNDQDCFSDLKFFGRDYDEFEIPDGFVERSQAPMIKAPIAQSSRKTSRLFNDTRVDKFNEVERKENGMAVDHRKDIVRSSLQFHEPVSATKMSKTKRNVIALSDGEVDELPTLKQIKRNEALSKGTFLNLLKAYLNQH